MSKKNIAHLENSKLIAGFFREALFFSRNIFIESTGYTGEARIVEIVEPSARTKSDERYLMAKPVFNTQRNHFGAPFEAKFKCVFPQFVAIWNGEVACDQEDVFKIRIPQKLAVSNNRESLRFSPANNTEIKAIVSVTSGGIHSEGRFVLEDISMTGVGGVLTIPAGISVRSDTRVTGVAATANGTIRIDGVVTQVTVLTEPTGYDSEYVCRIGVDMQGSAGNMGGAAAEKFSVRDSERRKARRVISGFELIIRSPLNPNHIIRVQVQNVSIGGFAGTLRDSVDQCLVPLGCGVTIEGTSLVGEVVAFSEGVFRLQFISGVSADRVKWLRRISYYENERTAITSGVGLDLINLFCESGAVASGFLKVQHKNSEDILFGMAGESGEEPYIHRWIERLPDGETCGHIAAVQWGDASWFIGDIAGSVETERKISREFIEKFFHSFCDAALLMTPCPKMIIAWNEGHPYWRQFERNLDGPGCADVRSIFLTEYTRCLTQAMKSPGDTAEVKKICAAEYQLIDEISSMVRQILGEEILKVFDFTVEAFGSPALSHLIGRATKTFKREYFDIQCHGFRWLGIINRFPLGVSANRSEDVAWLIPLQSSQATKEIRDVGRGALLKVAFEMGIDVPGVLEVIPGAHYKSDPGSTSKRMRWNILHPRALTWFGRKE